MEFLSFYLRLISEVWMQKLRLELRFFGKLIHNVRVTEHVTGYRRFRMFHILQHHFKKQIKALDLV